MKLTARQDIEAPIAAVFDALTDHDSFERAALRRGAKVRRGMAGTVPEWRIEFEYRGKTRKLTVRQVTAERPLRLVFAGEAKSVEGGMTVDLVETAPRRTRMVVATEVVPRTLAARLFLQSLKLARGRVMKRFQKRLAQVATMIEARQQG